MMGLRPVRRPHQPPLERSRWAALAVAIGAYSGIRLDEICSLRVEDVSAEAMRIAKAKNANSIRAMPIHPTVATLVARLRESSTDGYLIADLKTPGTDEKRSHSLSTRYRPWLDRLGLPDTR